jgi:hypothetical protein
MYEHFSTNIEKVAVEYAWLGGDKRKIKKVIDIPEYDKETHKWCNLCESIKELDKFYKEKSTKDGLCANCKSCKAKQKKEYLKRIDNSSSEIIK